MPVTVRPAQPEDSATILGLIRRLAAFEDAAGAVILTEEVIRRDAFGDQRRFEVLLAERSSVVCGLVVLLTSYSSWHGAPTLVIHDLFVDEAARGSGAGRSLLTAAAQLAQHRECCRIDLNVVGWNEAAQKFYLGLGFTPVSGWQPYRLDRDGLARLAEG